MTTISGEEDRTYSNYRLCNCIVFIEGNKYSPLGRQTYKKHLLE
jgi:hypothetical protein